MLYLYIILYIYTVPTLGVLCDEDLELIENWTFDLTLDQESQLTPAGKLGQQQLGSRIGQRFPELLDQPYSSDIFRVGKPYVEYYLGCFERANLACYHIRPATQRL